MCGAVADTVKSSADAAAREQLAKVVEVLCRDKVASFEECIAWARLKFQVRGLLTSATVLTQQCLHWPFIPHVDILNHQGMNDTGMQCINHYCSSC